jgi:hypothetical protein
MAKTWRRLPTTTRLRRVDEQANRDAGDRGRADSIPQLRVIFFTF